MTTDREELVWLAGFIEGEGSFDFDGRSFRVQAKTTDKDVADYVAKLIDGAIYHAMDKRGNRKVAYTICVRGNKAINLAMTLYPLMKSEHRRSQIKRIIEGYLIRSEGARARALAEAGEGGGDSA